MTAPVIAGTLLVVLTWLAMAGVLCLAGLGPASLGQPVQTPIGSLARRALWWGLGVLVVMATGLSLATPLAAPASAVAAVLILGLLSLWGAIALRLRLSGRRPRLLLPARRGSIAAVLLAGAGASTAVAYLAYKALGPATNYDTGLYHLGTIRYLADFGTVPGVANLFFPFGYSNSWFSVAALASASPWHDSGMRLVNGLLVVLVLADVAIRATSRRRGPGSWILAIGLLSSLIPLAGLADVWVTSPTSDTPVYLLTFVALAYLGDALTSRSPVPDGQVVLIASLVMVSMRPTTLPFALTATAILVIQFLRSQKDNESLAHRISIIVVAVWAAALGAVQASRDVLLSGWLLYPLSLVRFDVPWAAADPIDVRTATLVNARDPYSSDAAATAHGWGWVVPWLRERTLQWETYFLIVLVLLCLVVCIARLQRRPFALRQAVILALPSGVALATWFLAGPPSYRFVWGPLFSLPIIVTACALGDGPRRLPHVAIGLLSSLGAALIVVVAFCVGFRSQADTMREQASWTLGPVTIPYAVAPLPRPPTRPFVTDTGLELSVRVDGNDQCWDNFPLCTPTPDAALQVRGDSLGDGFTR